VSIPGEAGFTLRTFDRCFYLNGGKLRGLQQLRLKARCLGVHGNRKQPKALNSALSLAADTTFHFGHLSFGPTGSLQYTNVYIDGFNERNSLAPLRIHTDSEESLRTDLASEPFIRWQLGKITLEPFLKAMWEPRVHVFGPSDHS